MPADRWELLVKALAPKPRAMDSKRGWVALAQDWMPECKAMDASDGWEAMCRAWGGAAAAMDEQQRDADGKFSDSGGGEKSYPSVSEYARSKLGPNYRVQRATEGAKARYPNDTFVSKKAHQEVMASYAKEHPEGAEFYGVGPKSTGKK